MKLGRIGPVQLLVYLSRGKQAYRPDLPIWVRDVLVFLVAPTAQLFGVHANHPAPEPRD